ncbi:lipoprotein signal peptidase [candidate division SR1 bacterium]|nr:lipoprotein signal peptidase [candidate division SR1 bacterium]
MKKKVALFVGVLIMLVVLDQVSKWIFYSQELGSELIFLEPLFNTGISRGISMPSVISMIIAIGCSLLFCFLLRKRYLTRSEVCFLLAGTIGNLIDRVFLGGVRDFIAIGGFPVFNFADVFLTIGVILVFIREIFLLTPEKKGV